MKTPHHKAFEYTYDYTDASGKEFTAQNYIAVCPGVDVETLIRRWAMASSTFTNFKLIGEVPLKTALYAKGLKTKACIVNDWKLMDHMQFHTVQVSILSKG